MFTFFPMHVHDEERCQISYLILFTIDLVLAHETEEDGVDLTAARGEEGQPLLVHADQAKGQGHPASPEVGQDLLRANQGVGPLQGMGSRWRTNLPPEVR